MCKIKKHIDTVYCSILLFKGRDWRKTGEGLTECNAQLQLNGKSMSLINGSLIFPNEMY